MLLTLADVFYLFDREKNLAPAIVACYNFALLSCQKYIALFQLVYSSSYLLFMPKDTGFPFTVA